MNIDINKKIELWFIVLTYNSFTSINKTIDSIIELMGSRKTDPIYLGLLICDDASTDGTFGIIIENKKKILKELNEDKNFLGVNVLINKRNLGTVLNLDNGLNYLNKICLNENVDYYLKIIGADDEIISNEFNIAFNLIDNFRPDVQFNASLVHDVTNDTTYTSLSPQLWTYKNVIGKFANLKNHLIMSPSTITKLEFAVSISNQCKSIGLKLIEDWMYSTYAHNYLDIKIIRTRNRVVKYNIGGSSVTRSRDNEVVKTFKRDIYLQQKFNFNLVDIDIDNLNTFKIIFTNFLIKICLIVIKLSNKIESLVFFKIWK